MATSTNHVTVIIVGAGLGGLLMGLLCQEAKIPYRIFERSKESRPLGAVMSLNASVMPVFEQLGLMKDLMSISRPILCTHIMDENMKEMALLKVENLRELVGYDYIVFHRPRLYELLEKKLDPSRIYRGRKVLSLIQNENGVMIRTSDNQTHHGDILIGADGAYSAVRQALYKSLKRENKLPLTDDAELNTGYVTLVGTTHSLKPGQFPGLEDQESHFHQVIGRKKSYTWSTFTIPENKICWNVNYQIDYAGFKESYFRNSEWGPEANAEMIDQVKDFKVVGGSTMGYLIEQTDQTLISKVLLEDKLFQTWTSGRTVLIGDGKPWLLMRMKKDDEPRGRGNADAGQGAVNAFLDAVVLINCIYELDNDYSFESVKRALYSYQEERYQHVKEQYNNSKWNAKIQYGQKWTDQLARFLVFKALPKSIQTKGIAEAAKYRPQVAFLEHIPKRGKSAVLPQPTSQRFLRDKAARMQEKKQKELGSSDGSSVETEKLGAQAI
ncbi:hypothetical protein EDD11_002291 [Mortierella claussenii]|nr:hypothetical protein EDD11_002291 [Mortierella claussenii]